MDDGSVVEIPMLLPSSWMQVVLAECPDLLCGDSCSHSEIHEQLSAFWTCYEFFQPGHVVYRKDKNDLHSTIPIVVHGDEGRYLKKGNFMVCTIETVLGNDAEKKNKKKPCTCFNTPELSRYSNIGAGRTGDASFMKDLAVASEQHVNDSGNEFLTKFLVFGMSSLVYKKNKEILIQAFDMVARDLQSLHEHGLVVKGHTYFASTLGCKGDLKFHHQIGHLSRSYYNVGVRQNHPICSLCLAGQDGLNFEDVSDRPPWMETMYVVKPWSRTPSLATIPFQNGCPEAIFRLDMFHSWKVGLGRDLTGSTLIVLAQLGYFDSVDGSDTEYNLPARLVRAHSSFFLWCKACGKSPALHSFSNALLNYTNQQSFAWFNVKGSDNTLLTEWLLFVVKLAVATNGSRYPTLEGPLIETFQSATLAFQILHSHRLWMSRVCGVRLTYHLTVMIRGYKVLALESKKLGVVAYGLKPKLHSLDHINKDLKRQIDGGSPKILNPLCFSCEANESVVGHVARLSRRVSSRTVSTRVLDRVCIKVKSLMRKFKARLRTRRKR